MSIKFKASVQDLEDGTFAIQFEYNSKFRRYIWDGDDQVSQMIRDLIVFEENIINDR